METSVENNLTSEMSDEDFGEQMFTKLIESEAFFNNEEIMKVEENFVKQYGMVRRTALGVLSKSGKEIHDLIKDKRSFAVAMVNVYEWLPEYVESLQNFISLMETAHTRLMLSYCSREDMEEVFVEGREEETTEGGAK